EGARDRPGGRDAQGLRDRCRKRPQAAPRRPQAAQRHAGIRRDPGSLVHADAHGAKTKARRAHPSRHPHRQPHTVQQAEIVTREAPMRAPAVAAEVLRSPQTKARPQPGTEPRIEFGDLRFRALMTEEDWASLPLAIRRRFSKRLAVGQTIVYAGEILETRMSGAGWWFAQAARLIGGPLPLTRDIQGRARIMHVASVVTVTEDVATGGPILTPPLSPPKALPPPIPSI